MANMNGMHKEDEYIKDLSGKYPNIVLVISDQQRADSVTRDRLPYSVTPHLDWLAARGMRFTNAYCATPVCTPARTSIFSGLFPHAHGMVANHQEREPARGMRLPKEVTLLADTLTRHGYACAYTGKWHLGTGSDRRGFRAFATRHGDHDVDGPEDNEMLGFTQRIGVKLGGKQHGLDADPRCHDKRTKSGASLLPLAYHPSHRDAAAAGRFVHRMGEVGQPFFLVYSSHEPHPPFLSPKPFDRMVSPDDVVLPENWNDRVADGLRNSRSPGWESKFKVGYSENELRRMWASYLGAVAYVDHLTGVVLEALVDTAQFEDTVFIFTSDHGEMLGSHGITSKGPAFFQELVNIPLVITAPGMKRRGGESAALVSHVDLFPTILSFCGAANPGNLHGRDISPLVAGDDLPDPPGVAFEYHSGNWGDEPVPLRGWRSGKWKYVECPDGPSELYDLEDDPFELSNLVDDEAHRKLVDSLRDDLRSWLAEKGDSWPQVVRCVPLATD